MRWVLVVALAAACNRGGQIEFPQCTLDVVLNPTEALPGDAVAAIGGPLDRDTFEHAVRVGGEPAEVIDVSRNDACTDCDACYASEPCDRCESCPTCADTCDACVQSVTFVVPDLPAGEANVVITNGYGASPTLVLEVLDSGDTGR